MVMCLVAGGGLSRCRIPESTVLPPDGFLWPGRWAMERAVYPTPRVDVHGIDHLIRLTSLGIMLGLVLAGRGEEKAAIGRKGEPAEEGSQCFISMRLACFTPKLALVGFGWGRLPWALRLEGASTVLEIPNAWTRRRICGCG